MATPRTLLLSLFTSILIFSIVYFTPFSQSPLDPEALSLFDEPQPAELEQGQNNKELDFDQNDVVVLSKNNFSDVVGKNEYVMVKFYAPWCYWSQKLAPEYAAAATMLKPRAVLAQVDCTEQAELGRKFDIQGYPTVYLFVGGDQHVKYQFFEERTRDSIANWVNQKMNNAVQNLTSLEEAEHVLATKAFLVVGFLHSLQGEESEELAAVAKKHIDVDFYQTINADVAKSFHIDPETERPALVILERDQYLWSGNHTHFHYEGQFARLEIADFVSIYKAPSSVTTFTIDEAPIIFENPMKQLWLFAPNHLWKVISTFRKVAKMFKGKLLFVHVNTSDEDSIGRKLSYEFGVTEGAPTVVAYQSTSDGYSQKQVHHEELTLDDIKLFAEGFLEDKIQSVTYQSLNTVVRLPFDTHGNNDPSSIPHAY